MLRIFMELTAVEHPKYTNQRKMRNYVCILILFLSITACAQSKSVTYSNSSISKIVSEMASFGKYESSRVGFAGSPSQQHARMNELAKYATENDYKSLVEHKSPVVRVYSYMAMRSKYPKTAQSTYQTLSKDTTTIMTLEGCIGGSSTVGALIKRFEASAAMD